MYNVVVVLLARLAVVYCLFGVFALVFLAALRSVANPIVERCAAPLNCVARKCAAERNGRCSLSACAFARRVHARSLRKKKRLLAKPKTACRWRSTLMRRKGSVIRHRFARAVTHTESPLRVQISKRCALLLFFSLQWRISTLPLSVVFFADVVRFVEFCSYWRYVSMRWTALTRRSVSIYIICSAVCPVRSTIVLLLSVFSRVFLWGCDVWLTVLMPWRIKAIFVAITYFCEKTAVNNRHDW